MRVVEYRRRALARITASRVQGELQVEVLGLDAGWPDVVDPTPPPGYRLLQDSRVEPSWELPPDVVEVPVVFLDLREAAAFDQSWESWVRSIWSPKAAIVRESSVRPRMADVPLSFPLRVLEVVPPGAEPVLPAVFSSIFSGEDHSDAAHVLSATVEALVSLADVERLAPIVDVVHFDHVPALSAEELFDLTVVHRTRLVVIEATPRACGRLASALADLGGPAVLALPAGLKFELYLRLVHDEPLDHIAASLRSDELMLVGGAGREDLTRVSAIVQRLLEPHTARAVAAAVAGRRDEAELVEHEDAVDEAGADGAGFAFAEVESARATPGFLEGFLKHEATTIDALGFDQERRGTLPAARMFRRLDDVFRAERARAQASSSAAGPPSKPPTARHVNAVLHQSEGARRSPLDPEYGWVQPGQSLELAIQISPLQARIRSLGALAFLEEAIVYEKTDAALIEVGVTALDFELRGSPVQRLRLPRAGASDVATFRLQVRETPRMPGVARLRFCLYHRNALLQSFRVAVAHTSPLGWGGSGLETRFRQALDLGDGPVPALKNVSGGYFVRLEYSAFDPESLERVAPRSFSFFVNESAGETVVTVKGEQIFSGKPSPNLPACVQRAREVLRDSSYALDQHGQRAVPDDYRFWDAGEKNQGTPEAFEAALCDLAATGWALYDTLVPTDEQERFTRVLGDPAQIVHAGHLKLEQVVPWGLLYLRQFDDKSPAVAACSAPVADPLQYACGSHVECPLHPQHPRAAAGLTETAVACPRYFLGFRQQIEVPAQQAPGMPAVAPRALSQEVARGKKVSTLVGYNRALALAPQHLTSLQGFEQADFTPAPIDDRKQFLDVLKAGAPSVLYVYSHAAESFQARRTIGPHLVIQDGVLHGLIEPQDFPAKGFSLQPLVFLNGCQTAGFTPFAPAQFVVSLVNRGASAVIGTEAVVWELLAVAVAERFFRAFIDGGKTAGEALLETRLALLRKRNPLGLAYTLYGAADLRLAPATPSD